MNKQLSKEERWSEFEKDIHKKMENLNEEEKSNLNDIYNVALKLKENPTVATHFGDDLDNRSSIYVLENWSKDIGILEENENLKVERIPAGKTMENVVNVDTGGHKGSVYGTDTIVIDGDPANNVKSAIEELTKKLNVKYVPSQILECADALPTKTSIFDTRSGISLQKFTTIENVFEMAKNGLLTKELNDEQLEEYGLTEAHNSQQQIVDDAKAKVESYTQTLENGEKIVIAPKFIKAGSLVAYESGINYYASVDKHFDSERQENGVTFAINAKPGIKLPENIAEFGKELVEKYKDETGASGVFLHPNGSMLVAGGPKNPDFKVEGTQDEMIEKISSLFKEYSLISNIKKNINDINEKIEVVNKNEETIQEAKKLDNELNEHNKNRGE